MSAERDELRRLVDVLPEEQVSPALAELRRRAELAGVRTWPPAWFGAGQGALPDTAARVDELLDDGFGA